MSDEGRPAVPLGSAEDRAQWLRMTLMEFVISLENEEGYGRDEIAAALTHVVMEMRKGQ
jgi:hypothetical protein